MAKKFVPQIVTANDLFEGDAVYLTADCSWSREHGDAVVAKDPREANRLLKQAQAQADRIVGAYLAPVSIKTDGTPEPVHFREVFRTRGPSNYFHGKQEHAAAANGR